MPLPQDLQRRVSTLAREHPGPALVVDTTGLRGACAETRRLEHHPLTVRYAVGARTVPEALHVLREEGVEPSVTTEAGLAAASAAGFRPREILWAGPGLDPPAMRDLWSRRIAVALDSMAQVERWRRVQRGVRLLLRCQPATPAGARGLSEAEVLRLSGSPDVLGLVGTWDTGPSAEQVAALFHLARLFPSLDQVDLGPGATGDWTAEARSLATALGRPIRLSVPLDRAAVDACVVLACPVVDVKQREDRQVLVLGLHVPFSLGPHRAALWRGGHVVEDPPCPTVAYGGAGGPRVLPGGLSPARPGDLLLVRGGWAPVSTDRTREGP